MVRTNVYEMCYYCFRLGGDVSGRLPVVWQQRETRWVSNKPNYFTVRVNAARKVRTRERPSTQYIKNSISLDQRTRVHESLA